MDFVDFFIVIRLHFFAHHNLHRHFTRNTLNTYAQRERERDRMNFLSITYWAYWLHTLLYFCLHTWNVNLDNIFCNRITKPLQTKNINNNNHNNETKSKVCLISIMRFVIFFWHLIHRAYWSFGPPSCLHLCVWCSMNPMIQSNEKKATHIGKHRDEQKRTRFSLENISNVCSLQKKNPNSEIKNK